MAVAKTLWAESALTSKGWQSNVHVELDEAGIITSVQANMPASDIRVGILLPAMPNLHSHAFQRAMAGMTETRGDDPHDSFWSWRRLMYQFLNHLTPDDVQAIAAFGQIEMLEAGYTSVGEFHYLHHQADGTAYTNLAEMTERVFAASAQSQIGLTLLPVLYEQGGCDGRALKGGQKRFGNSIDQYRQLFDKAQEYVGSCANSNIGVAPHSLRAVGKNSLTQAFAVADGKPMHIHIAEQQAEVDELLAAYGARPVDWLLDNNNVNDQWCLVHATQMTPAETERLASSNCVAGLCPITESNLGDGIFDGQRYRDHRGRWGIGTDSNVRISLSEELRTLEYSQRLRDQRRVVYADRNRSAGRTLYEAALNGGAQALQRKTGVLAAGYQGDMLSLDKESPHCISCRDDAWLDTWMFAGDDSLVTDVWVAGNQVVKDRQHIQREQIESNYRSTIKALTSKL